MSEHMDPYDAQQELLQEEWLAERAAMRKLVTKWLREEQGVLCDCDNGWRKHEHSYLRPGDRVRVTDTMIEPCDRCTLIEVGGIRVRVLKQVVFTATGSLPGLLLPTVEVTDD